MRRIARIAAVVLATTVLLVSGSVAATVYADARTRHHVDIDAFMTGLACVESGGRFEAQNPVTGAYGKYQIMPRNWPVWSARYMHNRWALPTPSNQEYVARERIVDLYELRGKWRLVAHWWLTGNADADETTWSRSSTHYVGAVMSFARYAATPQLRSLVPNRCAPLSSITPDLRTTPWPHVRITGGRVYLRLAADYESRALGTAKLGDRFVALDLKRDRRDKRWVQVGLPDGTTAWVAAWLTNAMDKGLEIGVRAAPN